MPNPKFTHRAKPMPEGVPTRPLVGCEKCYWWRPTFCAKMRAGWPFVGDFCYAYEREPGVEG